MKTIMILPLALATMLILSACEDKTPVDNFEIEVGFTASKLIINAGKNITFSDTTNYTGAVYYWAFPGGSPANSTDRNPTVKYVEEGKYDVVLTIITPAGTFHTIKENYVTVNFAKIPDLIHFWYFNSKPAKIDLDSIIADSSKVKSPVATIAYHPVGLGATMQVYDNQPLSPIDLNAYLNVTAGYNLRLSNPHAEKEVIIKTPSTGFENLKLDFAGRGHGADAAKKIELSYSTNHGASWTKYPIEDLPGTWKLFTYDLSDINEMNNNSGLQFKIVFYESTGTSLGNQRLDNISLIGTSL
jgi:PKD repeat protein